MIKVVVSLCCSFMGLAQQRFVPPSEFLVGFLGKEWKLVVADQRYAANGYRLRV